MEDIQSARVASVSAAAGGTETQGKLFLLPFLLHLLVRFSLFLFIRLLRRLILHPPNFLYPLYCYRYTVTGLSPGASNQPPS